MERTGVIGRRLAAVGAACALTLGLAAVVGSGPAMAAPATGPTAVAGPTAVIRGNLIGGQSTHLVSHNGFGVPSGNGFLSVFQTIPSQTLNVTVGVGTPFTLKEGDFNFGGIAPGTYPVTTTGMTGSPSGSVSVPAAGNVTTLIYLGASGTPSITGFTNDLTAVPTGQSRMVFRNTAEGGPVDITVNGTSVTPSPLVNDGATIVSRTLPGGPVNIVVKNDGSQTTVASLNAVLTPGLLVNEFVTGQQSAPAAVSLLSNAIPLASGYRLFASDGGVFSFPAALPFLGSLGDKVLNQPIVGSVTDPLGLGYWMVASDGGVFSFGDTHFFGSMGNTHLNKPVVGMATTQDGNGYWLVASDGGMFAFGDANFYGSEGGKPLTMPIVGMAATADGGGYWLVAADGGMFAFGDAVFFGSMGGKSLNKPIVGMMSTPDSLGYWLVASDGGLFSFGDAPFFGSTGGMSLNKPIVAGNPSGSLIAG